MLFNSFTYAIFLIIVVAIYWILSSKWRSYFLLLSSYFFYGTWKLEGLLLLLLFSVSNWIFGQLITSVSGQNKKWMLGVGISFNLTILCIFKYYNFFLENISFVLNNFNSGFNTVEIILPLGISFITFEAVSFLVDTYKTGKTIPDFSSFALYISFFPHLIAGPIIRVKQFVPQLIQEQTFSWSTFFAGIDLLCIGFFKKVVVADNLAGVVDNSFKMTHSSAWDIWITGGLFSLQIYLDFAGYTDIARGSAKLLSYELPINFDFPYVSRSIGEFWRRWHITLSNWLRDYLYIPLGGSRAGQQRTYLNLLVTMALGGMWHGAGWTYIIWGLYQGGALVVHRIFSHSSTVKRLFEETIWGNLSAWALTYFTIIVGWIIFRSHDLSQLSSWIQTLITPTAYTKSSEFLSWSLVVLSSLIIMKLLSNFHENARQRYNLNNLRPLFYPIILFLLAIFAPQSQQFIYFQF
jgi:alginate O-acetyltransferase complex protein AlgI